MENKKDKNVDSVKSEADKIWDEIKDKPIDMFALQNQVVANYCKPQSIEPSKLFLLSTATAVLPSLEAAIGSNYTVELVDKFIVVSRATPSLTKK